jgi:hypothetical protein
MEHTYVHLEGFEEPQYHRLPYIRYLDEMLIVYNTHITNMNNTLSEFNTLQQRTYTL